VSITRDQCSARGGTYVPSGPDGNGPACRFIDTTQPVGQQVSYIVIQEGFSDWFKRTASTWSDNVDEGLGTVVQTRDDAVTVVKDAAAATGLDKGLLGAASKLLGVDLNVVLIIIALLAFYIVKSGALTGVVRVAAA
jgi:hypothetical protein